MAGGAPAVVNAMTVDVEDYFQVEAFARTVPRDAWEGFPRRVEANTDRILALFAAAGVRATFFTLGWVAERHPALVRRIVAAGHELASHGHGHARVVTLSPEQFRQDVVRARALLEDIGGVAVAGYRAPTFSIGPATPFAYPVLAETGHRYSSSIYPVRHDLYGAPDAPRFPHPVAGGALWEVPMTTLRVRGHNLPISGGGYFRLLPYAAFRRGLAAFNRAEQRGGMFYTHPWEIDPGQPRIGGAGRLSRFRHYLNLARTAPRLERLLRDFAWGRMDAVFPELAAAPALPAAAAQPRAA
jgi:polysaccharide deacetylase family protein (PEP-CTERM system associated)